MFAIFKQVINDWELDIFKRKSHITCFRVRVSISLDLHQPVMKGAKIYSKQDPGLSYLGSEGLQRILFQTHGLCWRREGGKRGKGGLRKEHTRQGESFLSTYCSLSFTARIFEQKLTVRRNPLLALLHFQLLFYSLFSHLGPSYLHNEKRFGGEEERVSIIMACLVSLYCK